MSRKRLDEKQFHAQCSVISRGKWGDLYILRYRYESQQRSTKYYNKESLSPDTFLQKSNWCCSSHHVDVCALHVWCMQYVHTCVCTVYEYVTSGLIVCICNMCIHVCAVYKEQEYVTIVCMHVRVHATCAYVHVCTMYQESGSWSDSIAPARQSTLEHSTAFPFSFISLSHTRSLDVVTLWENLQSFHC